MFFCAMAINSIFYLFFWVSKVLMNKSGKALFLLLLLLFAGYYLMFCGSLINFALSSSHQSIQLGHQKIKNRNPKEHSSTTVFPPAYITFPGISCYPPPTFTLVLNVWCRSTCISHSIWMSQSWYHHCNYQCMFFLPSSVLKPLFFLFLLH